jgi:ribosomal subunit interface protein
MTMRITITARHCDVSAELRERARGLLDRLSKVALRPQNAQVIFGADHATSTVEVRLHAARGRIHVATGDGTDHRTALDRAVAKVRRQLDKARDGR